MTKFEEEFNYLIELSGKVLLGQVDAETFKKNRIAFFEKYETDQQQALPVVPEDVAEWIEILKTKGLKPLKNPETYEETGFTEETLQNIVFWISEHQEDYMRAWLDGYTVEKPQLFYLKNKLTTSYLALDTTTGYYEHWGEEIIPKLLKKQGFKISFTQQEIDSMQTGSYEQIEVAE
ncbi:hypothetical protein LLT6_11350 [Lactococcus cremoris subsp. cremoris TIFN6]|uniref:DUF1642 domain-containing protein n=1 Tax=Lactococcus cremoris subsp. cremoris TIFN6 TaxID=1234876 RepID=T0SE78_LACLC|nr:hypothetical protein LLT6_11350 [Lactococcus cremoris subsp. cremoris TIFN6]QGJ84662.1 hypothetical protein [Lactococcus phage proPhi6]